jgi:hypothetical protein
MIREIDRELCDTEPAFAWRIRVNLQKARFDVLTGAAQVLGKTAFP